MPRLRRATPYYRASLFLANYSHDRCLCSVLRPRSLLFRGLHSCVASPVSRGFAMKTMSELAFRLLPAFSRRNRLLVGAGAAPTSPPVVVKDCASPKSSSQPRCLCVYCKTNFLHPLQVRFKKVRSVLSKSPRVFASGSRVPMADVAQLASGCALNGPGGYCSVGPILIALLPARVVLMWLCRAGWLCVVQVLALASNSNLILSIIQQHTTRLASSKNPAHVA